MRYLANPATPAIRSAMSDGLIGMIASPAQRIPLVPSCYWAADNGCWGAGYPGDSDWIAWLHRFAKTTEERSRCLFATAPDVLGNAAATLIRSAPFLPKIRALGYPAAFVAQDGLEDLEIPWSTFDVLFLGGTTSWKISVHAETIARAARERGKHVHMGRVNSLRRLRYAQAIGCSSVDGTILTFGPDVNLIRVRRWMHELQEQTALPLWEASS